LLHGTKKAGLAFFFNGAKKKAGEQPFLNRLSMMKDIATPWHMNNLNNDRIKNK